MARCFVTRRLPGRALERLAASHEVEVWPDPLPPPEIPACDGLLALLTDRVDEPVLARVGVVSNYAVGCDNVDLAAATRLGVPVGITPDVLTETTADLTWALMLAAARRVVEGAAAVRAGEWATWEPSGWLGAEVHGSLLLVVGPGRIGSAVARRAAGFGMQLLTAGRSDELLPLLPRADFVSLHCPLSASTRGLIGEDELRAMKGSAILVNTARGPLVDSVALRRALTEGWIGGAALDVTDPEPLPPLDPLLAAPSLLVVPHIGSATHRTRERMAEMAVDNLLAALAGGRMPHCANPEVYERISPRSP